MPEVAWYDNNSNHKTHAVGLNQPNGLGLYDMSGNVLEWAHDWYGRYYYETSPVNNPQGPTVGYARMVRGGSWKDNTLGVRSAIRLFLSPDYENNNLGFRLARTL